MKKKLLYLIIAICCANLPRVNAQSGCSNCYAGRLLPDSNGNMPPHPVTPNGSGLLAQNYVLQNVCGLNYTTTSQLTETRTDPFGFNTGGSGFPLVMNILNLPCGGGGSVVKAFAYWQASYTEATPPACSIVVTNPIPATATYAATNIGQGASTCWGTTGTACYRADITPSISGNGNYNINLTGFANVGYEVDGITIIIVYTDPAATYSGSISLWDGCIVNTTGSPLGPNTYNGFTACAASSNTTGFMMLGDCQNNVSGGVNSDVINGTSSTFNNNFWNFNVWATANLTSGQTSISSTAYTNNSGDCFAWELTGLYWQNTTCVVCTPLSNLNVSVTSVNPTCGNCNGSVTAVVSGGSAPYTYLWAPGNQTTATITGLCGGSYTVTVHDACGDVGTASVTLSGNSLAVAATAITNEKCNGDCIGSANATITGGTAPFTYNWTPSGGSGSSATALCAGNYTVTVEDNAGCTGTASVTITQPALLISTPIVTNIPCAGGIGSINANVTGGTSPYNYLWNPSAQTNAIATGLTMGSYTVTVTDVNGCTTTASASITQPTLLTAAITATTYPLCGGGTGTSTVTGTGGTLNYTYNWTPIGGTNATGTGLTVGTYTATVTDANGCTATASVTITQPTPVVATITGTTYPACGGGVGTSTAAGAGGTGPYNYSWNPGGQTNAMATGLTAGSYTVTVKDVNGCNATASVSITQPTTVTVTTSFTQASCNLPNGSATANALGGTSPYTYAWNPSAQTNATATGLIAGTYTVTVTDNNNCNSTASVTVTQPSAVLASITGWTGVSCSGGTNGTATAAAAGGTGPYNYVWAPGGNTNATGTGLSAGTYTMTVTDANGCQSTVSATITQPQPMTVVASGPQTLCINTAGTFTATVTGGTAPFIYNWSTGATTSIATITPVASSTFTVTVTDADGCTASSQTTINFGPQLVVAIAGKTSACSGRSITICANTSGGTGGNTYLWQPGGATTPCITVSPTANITYTVSVADNCGTTTTASAALNINPYPAVGLLADVYQGCSPLCIQFHNTTSNAGPTGQYVWSFGNGDTLQSKNPIYCYSHSGSYDITLTVTSDSGCSATLKKVNLITVYNKPVAAFTYSPQPASILNPTIQFKDESTNKYGIAYWIWNFGDGIDSISNLENPAHTYQDTGNYCVTLIAMDEHGCTDTATNCLAIDPAYSLYIPSAFSPNGDSKNETFQPKGQYIKNFEMYIFDRWGMKLYHTTDITKGWNGTVGSGTTVAQEDTYVYKIFVTDSEGKQHSYIGNVTLLK